MATAKQVINSIKPKKIPQNYETPKGEIGYDNIRDDIERVKKMREGLVEKTPTLAKDIVNKEYVDNENANYLLNTGDTSTGNYTFGGIIYGDAIGTGLDILHSATIGNHLTVGDNIIVGGTVDGIDIATDVAANTTHRGLTNEHLDWEADGVGTIHVNNYVDNDTTYTSSDFDHDQLTNTHNLTTDISHDSIADVSADDHHNESHNAASHSDISSTGANIDDAVSKKHTQNTDTALGSGCVADDHGTAATDQVVNVCYGTGEPPAANTTTEGTIWLKYTA